MRFWPALATIPALAVAALLALLATAMLAAAHSLEVEDLLRRLLETIAGIRRPDRGEIHVGARVLFSTATRLDVPARHRGIGYVPQDALLFPHLDVKANIEYGRRSPDIARAGVPGARHGGR